MFYWNSARRTTVYEQPVVRDRREYY